MTGPVGVKLDRRPGTEGWNREIFSPSGFCPRSFSINVLPPATGDPTGNLPGARKEQKEGGETGTRPEPRQRPQPRAIHERIQAEFQRRLGRNRRQDGQAAALFSL